MNKNKSMVTIGKWSAILLIGAGTQISLITPLQAATLAKKETTDKGITSAVENELLFEKGIFPDEVDAGTNQGIVTLSGSVDNVLAKERIVQIAESIRGVRGVIDRLNVIPVSRPDQAIRKDIMAALKQDPATQSYPVNVSVKDAVATLTGGVGSYMEKQLAGRIAKGVKGAREVRNDVSINYTSKRTDKEISADVKEHLQWDIWTNSFLISVAVKDGIVTLTGTVGNADGKSRAFDNAWVNGVVSVVDSAVKIEPLVLDETRRKLKYASVSDGQIKQAIKASFGLDPRVSAFSPEATVESGEVYLFGQVGNLKAKTSAQQDAKNIVGVWRVDNFLKVRPKELAQDAEMKAQLKDALFWDPLLDGDTINATVNNRIAYLSGEVRSSLQKAEAQDIASRVKGLVSISNRLKVEPDISITYYDWPINPADDWIYGNQSSHKIPGEFGQQPYLSDEQIKKNIEDGFFWNPYVERDAIKVTVDGGVAVLTGTVGTWIGMGEINKDAYNSGATKVVNRVKIDKGAWLWE